MTKLNKIKVLVPCYIDEKEKYEYYKKYLKDGYRIQCVYDYDQDYDVYVLVRNI